MSQAGHIGNLTPQRCEHRDASTCRCLAIDAPAAEDKLACLSEIAQENGVEWDAAGAAAEMLPSVRDTSREAEPCPCCSSFANLACPTWPHLFGASMILIDGIWSRTATLCSVPVVEAHSAVRCLARCLANQPTRALPLRGLVMFSAAVTLGPAAIRN